MALPVDYFQPESFEQANPMLSGIEAAQQIYNQGVQNQYLPQSLASQIALMRAQTNAQNALPNYYGAMGQEALGRGNYFNAQGNLISQQTPWLVKQAQANVYSNPLLQLANQLQMGENDPATAAILKQFGVTNQQQGTPTSTTSQNYTPTTSGSAGGNTSNGQVPLTPAQQQKLTLLQHAQQAGQPLGGQMINAPSPYPAGVQPTTGQPVNTGAVSAATPSGVSQAPPIPGLNGIVGGNALANYLMTGSPLISPQMQAQMKAYTDAMSTQATGSVDAYNKAQADASEQADTWNQIANYAKQFKENYDKSYYKGSTFGNSPTTGIESLPYKLIKGGDLSPEQAADQATGSLVGLTAKAMIGGRVTNTEWQAVGKMKPNRALDPQAASDVTNFYIQKAQRYQEYPAFLAYARQQGIQPQVAQTAWNVYNNVMPVMDFKNHQINPQNLNTWKPFLNNDAVSAYQNGQMYVPLPQAKSPKELQNWFNQLPPPYQAVIAAQKAQGGG